MEKLPQFLKAMFQGTSLASVTSSLAVVTPAGEIRWVNDGWRDFARANGGEELIERFGPGASYFDGISQPLRGFYESLVANAHLTGEPCEQDYECSSPETFRMMHLRILPFGAEGLLLEHSMLVERAQEAAAAAAIESLYRSANGIIVQCSNCRRVQRADGRGWDWVREWVSAPALATSHGICKTCIVYYWGARLRQRRLG